MKILHVITDLEVGGAETLLTAVLTRLQKEGEQIHVAFFYGDSWIPEQLREAGITLHRLPSAFKADPRAILGLSSLIRRLQPDLLHSHLIQGDWAAFAARRIAGGCIPHISTKHNLQYFRDHPRWLQSVDAAITRRLSAVIAVSNAVAKDYITNQGVAAERLAIIPNGIDCARFARPSDARERIRKELKIGLDAPVLVTVASMTEQKGHAVMLAAIPEIASRFPNLVWIVVGTGKIQSEIRQMADQKGIAQYCRFLGNRRDIPDLLHASDVFVLPSLWEGFGIAALEAAAAGLPLALSRTGGLEEVFGEPETAMFSEPGNSAGLARNILHLLEDPAKRIDLGHRAMQRAGRFDLDNIAKEWLGLYRRLVAPS
jgi:glycosyltransferase involved in cell wall biosynthesis